MCVARTHAHTHTHHNFSFNFCGLDEYLVLIDCLAWGSTSDNCHERLPMKNCDLNVFAISGTNMFPALIPSAWTLQAWLSAGHMFFCVVRLYVHMCEFSLRMCVQHVQKKKRRPKREREWLLGKWLGLGVTCSAMHWWSCETCSNYTLLKKKVDPLSWAESVCTCVQEGALVCVCVQD